MAISDGTPASSQANRRAAPRTMPSSGTAAGGLPKTGNELADKLDGGWTPPQVTVPMRLSAGESCYAQAPVKVSQFYGTDAEWTVKMVHGLSAVGITMKMFTAMGNSRRKAKAEREAEAQWRDVAEGTVFLTDKRVVIRHKEGWESFAYQSMMQAEFDGTAITFEGEGWSPTRLYVGDAGYFFVLFHFLAFGQVTRLAQPTSA